MRFAFEPIDHWPPLAWLSICEPGADHVVVQHGPSVECSPDWFCEAVWDGPYAAGDFDRTDRVFGSGGRQRSEGVVFVSSATTVDRLCSIETDRGFIVSNSLGCLVARRSVSFEAAEAGYADVLLSTSDGIRRHQPLLQSLSSPIRMTVHDNLVWDGSTLEARSKPDPTRDFSSFALYRSFLSESLAALSHNLRAPERARPLDIVSTASSGYDSSAVTVLAAEIGLRDVVTIGRSRYDRDDSGLALIDHLGLEPVLVERSPEGVRPFTIVPFVVGDGVGRDVFLAGAEAKLAGRVLLSGYYGDTAWNRVPWDEPERERDLACQGTISGLSLTEFRLWAGFIHCPVPFLGARDRAQICALSNSDDMRPWARGGDYDRPVPRRIVEETGLPSDAFGVSKKVAGLLPSYRPDLEVFQRSDPEAAEDLRAWLRSREGEWARKGRLPPLRVDALESLFVRVFRWLWRGAAPALEASEASRRYRLYGLLARLPATHISRFMFPWAMSRAIRRYAPAQDEGRALDRTKE